MSEIVKPIKNTVNAVTGDKGGNSWFIILAMAAGMYYMSTKSGSTPSVAKAVVVEAKAESPAPAVARPPPATRATQTPLVAQSNLVSLNSVNGSDFGPFLGAAGEPVKG